MNIIHKFSEMSENDKTLLLEALWGCYEFMHEREGPSFYRFEPVQRVEDLLSSEISNGD